MLEKKIQILKSIDSRLRFIENSICVCFGFAFGWFISPIIEKLFN